MLAPWKKSYDHPRQHIKKQRHYFAYKSPSSQRMVFPVVMDGFESWTIKKTECQRIDAFVVVVFYLFIFWRLITLQYCIGFAIHWHESATGVHVSIHPEPSSSLLPPSPSHPSRLSQCIGFECPASCIKLGLVIQLGDQTWIWFTYGNIHVSMLVSQIISPSPSPIESKSLFFISLSLLLSCT